MLVLAACICAAPVQAEVCRIRVYNYAGGLVQVSVNGGRLYGTVGRVSIPARARIQGFAAASYVDTGSVAATAIHGLRIKTGQYARGVGLAQKPMVFSISPAEFSQIPAGYGGHRPRSSAIQTDIPAGHSIFRNFAPYVGSRVFLERDRALKPLPGDYVPEDGDVFVIVVDEPTDSPVELVFQNHAAGAVTARYADGRSVQIARVLRPVRGVGRYDGTTFTGVGSINTNHPGVITISTAPVQRPGTREGEPPETRGGFMIQPRYHAAEHSETAPQVMVVESMDESTAGRPALEGTAPLFFGCISLSRFESIHQDKATRLEVRIDDGEWESAPEIVGKADNAFGPAFLQDHFAQNNKPRVVKKGVTALRLLLPLPDAALLASQLNSEVAGYLGAARGFQPVRGSISLEPAKAPRAKSTVKLYVDGFPVAISNKAPYSCLLDTTVLMNGLHYVELETIRDESKERSTESRLIKVDNR